MNWEDNLWSEFEKQLDVDSEYESCASSGSLLFSTPCESGGGTSALKQQFEEEKSDDPVLNLQREIERIKSDKEKLKQRIKQVTGMFNVWKASKNKQLGQLDEEVKKRQHELRQLVDVHYGDSFEHTVRCTCTRKSKCKTPRCQCHSAKVRCGDSCCCTPSRCANRNLPAPETLREQEVVVNVQVGDAIQTLRVPLGAARE